jgi:hypothetical protein
MEGLSAAAGGMAVVSLAVQLIQLTQSLRDFIKDVSGAPSEIKRLTSSLTQLANILQDVQHVTDIQGRQEGSPPPPPTLLASLQSCEDQLLQLQSVLTLAEQKMRVPGRITRQWESFKVVFRRKDVENFVTHLDQAIQYLSIAMTMNLTILQYVPTIFQYHMANKLVLPALKS